ncbi:glycosyltransferase [Zooshikella harenae]|uniref:Glycosyltransferase n=1 Tax=Zooshikella harenae TaxID=2827238 RepID=A0ABS5Z9M9_9GAMM|nr:glycosyltransferase [Zooshikella harenae]MBU2710695.1 glycosyltransferase [Zooshikella harenae]
MNRKKVLQLQQKYYIRTSDLHEEIIKGLPREDFEVTAAYFCEEPAEKDMITVAENKKYFKLTKKQMKGFRLKAVYQLWKYCKDKAFNVVITHRFKSFDVMLIVNKLIKIPNCISVVHGVGDFDRLYRRFISNLLIDDKWTIVAVSQTVKEYIIKQCKCFNDHNVKVIPNAVDLDYIESNMLEKNAARQEIEVDESDVIIGTIGRLVKVKGHEYLIKSFAEISQKDKSIKLVIIGGGELEQSLQNLAKNLGVEDRVLFTGEIFNAYRLLKAFDLFVLPSLEEGMPLVIFEALIAKVPIISTNVGGIPEVINDTIAKLVPPTDIDSLISQITEFLDLSVADKKRIIDNGYYYVKENHSIKIYRERYKAIISRS